jgi:hypothetical protein
MTSTAWRGVEADAREAARHPVVRTSARIGLAARGVLYMVVAVLALRIAFGDAREAADKNGALLAVARQPFGEGLLAALAVGFAGYCIWMLVRVVVVDDDASAKTWAKRVAYLFRASVYGVLAWSAFETIRRAASAAKKSGNRQQQEWSARVLGWPGGRVLLAVVGAALVIGGASFVYRAVTEKWRERLDLEGISAATRRSVRVVAWAGWLGRGTVFGLVGVFIARAGWQFDAKEAVGLDGALRRVAHGTWGPFLLCVLAFGLFAFGCYSMIEARFRRVTET